MNLPEVLDSKIFVKDGAGATFQSPRTYIEPFLDAIKFDGNIESVTVKTQGDVVNENEDGHRNVAFPRIAIEAKVGSDAPLHSGVIGMVYALDLQKPQIKVYTGQNASACTNLTIFNAEHVFNQDVLGNYTEVYRKVGEYKEKKEAEVAEFTEIYNDLTNTAFTEPQLNEEIGRILRKAPFNRIGVHPIIQGVSRLDKKGSDYYVEPGSPVSKMHLYEAITQSFTNAFQAGRGLLDRATQTVQLSRMFLN